MFKTFIPSPRKKIFFLFLFLGTCCHWSIAQSTDQPNFLVIMVDDWGWKDVGCYGSEFYQTPNVDQLANEGIKFTQAYSAHPRCVPSRFGFYTGKFPARSGIFKGTSVLPKEETTFAEVLNAAGYQTFFTGKWHLAGHNGSMPEEQGFETNIGGGHAGAPATYFYPYNKDGAREKPIYGLEDGKEGDYLSDALTDQAIHFLQTRDQSRPFLLMVAHYGVHTPLESKKSLEEKYDSIAQKQNLQGPEWAPEGPGETRQKQNNATYAGMIESVDESVGRMMEALSVSELMDNTIIILTSDHGGLSTRGDNKRKIATSNLPLRAGKGWLYEGGIRVPFIIKTPEKQQITEIETPIILTDVYPTLLEFAGLKLQPQNHLDGQSIVPLLRNTSKTEVNKNNDRQFIWHSPTARPYSTGDYISSAIRIGNYKLIEWYRDEQIELFDLSQDLEEQKDLSESQPEKAQELLTKLKDWKKENNIYQDYEEWVKKKFKRSEYWRKN